MLEVMNRLLSSFLGPRGITARRERLILQDPLEWKAFSLLIYGLVQIALILQIQSPSSPIRFSSSRCRVEGMINPESYMQNLMFCVLHPTACRRVRSTKQA
jgi:hypothetical protein